MAAREFLVKFTAKADKSVDDAGAKTAKVIDQVGKSADGTNSKLESMSSKSSKSVRDFGSSAESSGKKANFLSGMLGGLATGGLLAVGNMASQAAGKVVDFLQDGLKEASDLNETMSKSQEIFGSAHQTIADWGAGAAKNLGLSKSQAIEAAAGFGNMFTQLGFSSQASADMSTKIVQLSADLGSFNNLPTAQVTDMMSAAFRGEFDSLQRVIPGINAARVEKEALALSGKANAKALTEQEKAQAVLAIVQKDGAKAQGDFARTSGGLANQQKILAAQTADAKAQIGEKLQPIVTKFMTWLNAKGIPILLKVVEWVGKIIDKAIDLKNRGVEAFSKFRDGMAKAMDGIRSAAAKPVNFVIQYVWNNGIRRFWNLANNIWGGDDLEEIKPIALARGAMMGDGRRPILWNEVPGQREAYIPINNSGRSRDLWMQAGRELGMLEMNRGGIIGTVTGRLTDAWKAITNLPAKIRELKERAAEIGSTPLGRGLQKAVSTVLEKLTGAVRGRAVADDIGAVRLGDIVLPANGPVTSRYGYRFNPISGAAELHDGTDIGAPMGAPVRSALGGTVSQSGWMGGFGLTVTVNHGGLSTRYSHLSQLLSNVGDVVEPGRVIGLIGSTGWSTGPHLHFSVLDPRGGTINPNRLIPTYDSGGWLQPGLTVAANNTGKPEAVLTADQWDELTTSLSALVEALKANLARPVMDHGALAQLAATISNKRGEVLI